MNKDIQIIENIWKILHSYEADLFGYIKHSVGSADIARDIYQDVYLQALQNIQQLDIDRSLKNWLMTVARNKVINYFREKKRREYVHLNDDSIQTEVHINNEYDKHIGQALEKLPESQRNIFIARELDELSYDEMAKMTGLSQSAVTSLLDRARKNFAKAILIEMMPLELKRNADKLVLEDLARFVDSFESLDTLLLRIGERSQQYFAGICKTWDEIRNNFIDNHRLNNIFMKLGEQQNKIVADLGSGTGFIALHSALQGSEVFAVDLNSKMLRQQVGFMNKLNLHNINLIQADLNILPLNKAQFDQVFLTLVLHHIDDPPAMLEQAAGILKSEGKLILIDFLRHKDRKFADQMHDLWLGFEPDKIKKWLKKIGLTLIETSTWDTKQDIQVFYQIYTK
jgi:RNA polymerase sigma factor (sigma-70 family)